MDSKEKTIYEIVYNNRVVDRAYSVPIASSMILKYNKIFNTDTVKLQYKNTT